VCNVKIWDVPRRSPRGHPGTLCPRKLSVSGGDLHWTLLLPRSFHSPPRAPPYTTEFIRSSVCSAAWLGLRLRLRLRLRVKIRRLGLGSGLGFGLQRRLAHAYGAQQDSLLVAAQLDGHARLRVRVRGRVRVRVRIRGRVRGRGRNRGTVRGRGMGQEQGQGLMAMRALV
jgi:hypothetical protein